MEKKITYKVMQGHFTSSGTGNEWIHSTHESKEEAIAEMKRIAYDASGLCGKTKGGYLLTSVWIFGEDAEDDECIAEIPYLYQKMR